MPGDGESFPPGLLKELAGFGTATLHEAAGGIGALPGGIVPLDPARVLWGRALTVWSPPGDNLALHRAVALARPGDVLVVDHGGSPDCGPFGDILALAAIQQGVAGLVIDGAVRDSASLIAMKFPVFARGRSIRGTIKRNPGIVGQALQIGQVTIHPGDLVFGDADGVVVLPPDNAEALREAAAARIQAEARLRDAILKGGMTLDLLGLSGLTDDGRPG